MHERLGRGGFADVYRVELVVPRGFCVLQNPFGEPEVDKSGQLLLRRVSAGGDGAAEVEGGGTPVGATVCWSGRGFGAAAGGNGVGEENNPQNGAEDEDRMAVAMCGRGRGGPRRPGDRNCPAGTRAGFCGGHQQEEVGMPTATGGPGWDGTAGNATQGAEDHLFVAPDGDMTFDIQSGNLSSFHLDGTPGRYFPAPGQKNYLPVSNLPPHPEEATTVGTGTTTTRPRPTVVSPDLTTAGEEGDAACEDVWSRFLFSSIGTTMVLEHQRNGTEHDLNDVARAPVGPQHINPAANIALRGLSGGATGANGPRGANGVPVLVGSDLFFALKIQTARSDVQFDAFVQEAQLLNSFRGEEVCKHFSGLIINLTGHHTCTSAGVARYQFS